MTALTRFFLKIMYDRFAGPKKSGLGSTVQYKYYHMKVPMKRFHLNGHHRISSADSNVRTTYKTNSTI